MICRISQKAVGEILDKGVAKMISVIVPTYNEEQFLPICLDSVRQQKQRCELIITDGGSSDGTIEIARLYTDLIVRNERADLASQLNAGAAAAHGDILLFLHADSRLTADCLLRLSSLPGDVIGGAYSMQVEGKRFFYRILSVGGNIYCRLTGTFFGDRGIFVRRDAFLKLGGYRKLPIMTDVDFSHRLREVGKTKMLPGPLITSGRKFDKEKPWRTLYLIMYALVAFSLRVDLQRVKDKYYS
jgi:rSAM/selenodomain-associated transferase 2